MEQIWNIKAAEEHYSNLSKKDLLEIIISLSSEGKNVTNILNQKLLAKKLDGEFVGDKIDDYDIIANFLNLELKCNVNQAQDLGKTLGMASFLQKKGWNYIIHYAPKAFNSYLDEDKFVVFNKSDINKAKRKEWINANGGIRWTYKIYNPNHKIGNQGGHREKLEFIQDRIVNFKELKQLIYA